MGWARMLALVGVLCAGTLAQADPRGSFDGREEAAEAFVSTEARLHVRLPGRFSVDAGPRLFDSAAPARSPAALRGRAFSFGYSVGGSKARLGLRAGYRYGLPFDETRAPMPDEGLLLTSGGTFAISAGTVAWLSLDVDGYKEIAGTRMVRLDAVPGLRFRIGRDSPYEAGVGCLATLKPLSTAGFGFERFAGVARISGRF